MTTRPQLRTILRAGVASATVAVLAGAGVAATALPLPAHQSRAEPRQVSPVPSDQTRVCAGPLYEIGADAHDASGLSSFGEAAVAADAADEAALTTDTLASPSDAAGRTGPTTVTVPADGTKSLPLVAGSQSQTAEQETLSGFAAATCSDSVAEAWLVAGSTDVGRTSLIILNNPSAVDAVVDLEAYSDAGPVDAPNGNDIQVPAGSQKVLSLAGIAPNVALPVVHVTSEGGDIQAWMQQSTIRGLVSSGVEMAGATTAPSTEQRVPVVVYGKQPKVSSDGYDDRRPSLRVLAPGSDPAHVEARVLDDSGAPVSTLAVDLEGGSVGEFPLGELPAGRYTLAITASSPVVAAARTTTELDESADFSWFAASGQLDSPFLVSAAPGPAATLVIHNPGGSAVSTRVGDDTATIEAGASHAVPLSDTVRVEADGPVMAVVEYAGTTGVSSFAVTPPKPASEPIDVYVR